MQASELKPGQFFEYDGKRYQALNGKRYGFNGTSRLYFIGRDFELYWLGNDVTVTSMNVAGWDDEPKGDGVTGIRVCKLPHQDTFFIYGGCNGKDVWLTTDGKWSENETGDECGFAMYQLSGLAEKHDQQPAYSRSIVDFLQSRLNETMASMASEKTVGKIAFWTGKAAAFEELIRIAQIESVTIAEPAPLQLREGAWYVSRDGSYTTQVAKTYDDGFFAWRGTSYWYSNSGRMSFESEHDFDLIAEVLPPEPTPMGSCSAHSFAPAIAQPDADGWIAWSGESYHEDGPCSPAQIVRVRFRDKSEEQLEASEFYWSHDGSASDIVAYRLAKQPHSEPPQPITNWTIEVHQ